ncbi:MAG: hypothetical protein M3033_17000 [Acidobacteriota bacterium]|nr:hypothetical protein [Acidobacteriota bacterium]
MSFLGQEETIDVFQCQNCNHFNSSKMEKCGKCSMSFSAEQKQSAIEKTKLETKQHNIKYYKNILIIGMLMFLGGGALITFNLYGIYSGKIGTLSLRLFLLMFVGIGQILWGARGLRAESKN